MHASVPARRPCSVCGSVSKHCLVCHAPSRLTIEAELFAGSDQLGVSRRSGISARSLVRHLTGCVPEKFERARRIREQAEMFAAMGRLESIESVMGEIRAYRQAAARDKDYGTAIRGCDVALRALALLSARPATRDVTEDAFYDVRPTQPIDLDRLAQLNEVIRQRGGQANAALPSTLPAVAHAPTNGNGGGSGS